MIPTNEVFANSIQVLHATPSLSGTLKNVRKLLAPGGRLFLQEVCGGMFASFSPFSDHELILVPKIWSHNRTSWYVSFSGKDLSRDY